MFGRTTGGGPETVGMGPRGGASRRRRWRKGGLIACMLAALQVACTAILVAPRAAWARPILFEGGGSGVLADDGSITGTAHVTLDEDTILGETTFEVTMPDGQVLQGLCLDRDHWAPANGSYPFLAKPQGDGSYQVTVNTAQAEAHPAHQSGAAAGRDFQSPPQRVGEMVWRPTYRYKDPEPVNLVLRKRDAQGSDADGWGAQGSATLAGARFELAYYEQDCDSVAQLPAAPTRRWTLETVPSQDGDAVARLDDERCVVGGDELYRTLDGKPTIPQGCLTVTETSAPQGYELDDARPRLVHISRDGELSWEQGAAGPLFYNHVLRAGVCVRKRDAELGAVAQGDASLAGFTFVLINRNDHAVVVNGLRCAPGARIESLPLVTDETGVARSASDALPLGSYELVEDEPAPGYLNDAHSQTVELSQAGSVVGSDTEQLAMSDHVARGAVELAKLDRETGLGEPLGAASLEGAVLEVTNASAHVVLVEGRECQPGEVCLELRTDEKGRAASAERALPYGSYRVRETQAPEGYVPNESWEQSFCVRDDGERVDLTTAEAAVSDQVKRSDLRFCKRAEDSMELMGHVAFLVSSLSTGEAHVIVTDENGCYDSSASWQPHTASTCANDAALREDGTLDESLLDAGAGLWFAGASTGGTQPDDSLGALPYDSYRVQELRCAANQGHALASWTVHVKRHGALLDVGTVDDHALFLQTELTDGDGSHRTAATDGLRLVDHVAYEGLTPAQDYQLQGELYRVGADGALELLAEGRADFTPALPVGSQDLDFELKRAPSEPTRVVAFERLVSGGQTVAEHRDADDEQQSVWLTDEPPEPEPDPKPEEPTTTPREPGKDPEPRTPQTTTPSGRTPYLSTPVAPVTPVKSTTPTTPAADAAQPLPQTGVLPLGPAFVGGGMLLCSGALIALHNGTPGHRRPTARRRRSYGARERARALRRRCQR